jgi:hypothetical protein
VNGIVLPWVGNNRSVIDKIKENKDWLDERLEKLEVFKPKEEAKESKSESSISQSTPIDLNKQDKDKKTYKFQPEKLNEIPSQI